MFPFIIIFLLATLLINSVLYWRFRPLLPKGLICSLLLGVVFLVFILTPMLPRLLALPDEWDEVLLIIGYGWLGFSMLAFICAVVTFILQLLTRLFISARYDKATKFFAALCLILSLSAAAHSFYSARNPQVETLDIFSSKLKPGEIVRVMQVSDMHLQGVDSYKHMEATLKLVQEAGPDLLVITGDFVDGRKIVPDAWARPWAALPMPKFAVLGNHERLGANFETHMEFMGKCGFMVLRNRGVYVKDDFYVAGVDDPIFNIQIDEKTIWPHNYKASFNLLLKHRPDIDYESAARFDLQLSGHTHGGQIYPGYWLTKMVHPMNEGLYQLASGSRLYVSRGAGTWGAPMRFLADPQVTLINIMGRP